MPGELHHSTNITVGNFQCSSDGCVTQSVAFDAVFPHDVLDGVSLDSLSEVSWRHRDEHGVAFRVGTVFHPFLKSVISAWRECDEFPSTARLSLDAHFPIVDVLNVQSEDFKSSQGWVVHQSRDGGVSNSDQGVDIIQRVEQFGYLLLRRSCVISSGSTSHEFTTRLPHDESWRSRVSE